jgi:hypothetical protein
MSTVILDTITGKSTATTITIGSTPVVSASANSMTIRGEGSAQTSIQQGLAKAWCTAASHSDGAINGDSFNISSYSDTATGRGRPSVTNAINNDYCVLTTPETSYPYVGFSVSTTVFEVSTVNSSGNYADGVNNAAVFGDLA